MAEADHPELVVSDLLAAVGEVLLRWGYLELAMLKKLEVSRETSKRRATPFQQWRDAGAQSLAVSKLNEEIQCAAEIRNLLAHGLIGASAQPKSGDPHVACRDLNGMRHEIKHADLVSVAQNIDVLRLRIHREPDDLLRPVR